MTQSQILEACLRGLSYPLQLTEFDFTSPEAIRFNYMGCRYRVSQSGFVEEVKGGMLHGSHNAKWIKKAIERAIEETEKLND